MLIRCCCGGHLGHFDLQNVAVVTVWCISTLKLLLSLQFCASMLLCLQFWASILRSVDVHWGGGDCEPRTSNSAGFNDNDRCVPKIGFRGGQKVKIELTFTEGFATKIEFTFDQKKI